MRVYARGEILRERQHPHDSRSRLGKRSKHESPSFPVGRRALCGLSIAGLATISAPAAQAADRVGTVTKRTGATVTIAPGLSAQATATCRRGETLIGGGALGEGTSFNAVFLRASGPDPGNARRWLARGYNNDAANHGLTAYAMCAKSARRDRVGVIVRSGGAAATLAAGSPGMTPPTAAATNDS